MFDRIYTPILREMRYREDQRADQLVIEDCADFSRAKKAGEIDSGYWARGLAFQGLTIKEYHEFT